MKVEGRQERVGAQGGWRGTRGCRGRCEDEESPYQLLRVKVSSEVDNTETALT